MIVVPIVSPRWWWVSRVLVMPNSSGVLCENHYLLRGDHHRRHHFGDPLANVFQPGAGVDMSQLATVISRNIRALRKRYKAVPTALWHDFVAGADEHRGVDGERRNVPIIFFSVLFGLGLSSLPATIVNRW